AMRQESSGERPDPPPREDPPAEPARAEHRAARRPGGIFRGLRFLALPLIPWVLIMALTPWGRGLFNDGKAKVQSLFGAAASPSASAPAASGAASGSSAPAKSPSTGAATVQLNPPSGKAGVSVVLTV